MKEKYRFNYQEAEKCAKDDVLWVFDNFIIGITDTGQHYKMNHYGLQFDKTNYIKVDLEYSLDSFYEEYMEWVFDEMEHWYL